MPSNKFPLAPLILAVAALGLGGYIYFYESHRATSDEAKEQHARLLPGLEAEMVQRLGFSVPASATQPAGGYEIARRPGESVVNQKAEAFEGAAALRWDLVKPLPARADRFAVENLINRLKDLADKYTDGAISLKDFKGRTLVLWFYPKADTPG